MGFDCCWVPELQVSGTKLDVPLCDSSSCSWVVEDVREWCAAHHRDGVLIEVVGYFPRRHDDGVHELFVVLVPLLRFVQDLIEVVDWPLDSLYFSFFQAFCWVT